MPLLNNLHYNELNNEIKINMNIKIGAMKYVIVKLEKDEEL